LIKLVLYENLKVSLNLTENTLDDLLRLTISEVIENGVPVSPTKGPNLEVLGAVLTLENPRARLSSSVTKGTIFSCVGELMWYLNGSDSLDFIEYYIKDYNKYSDDGISLEGAYGPRVFGDIEGRNQFDNIIELLTAKPSTRQAVIQIFDRKDLQKSSRDVPCTCNLQFLIRNNKLNLVVTMRSNDAFVGMPHDIFAFTMLQEIAAVILGIEVGIYKHMVGSLHIYEKNRPQAAEYLNEGWQPSIEPMPPMPAGNPAKSIEQVLEIEKEIRLGTNPKTDSYSLPAYWQDIVSLLKAYSLKKNGADMSNLMELKKAFNNRGYLNYVDKILELEEINDAKMLSITKSLIQPYDKLKEKGLDVIEWSSPVPVFGNLRTAKIATLGLNPSNREFVSSKGTELSGSHRRFPTLNSLGLKNWNEASRYELEQIQKSWFSYFENNPYDRWFKTLNDLLAGTNFSFYNKTSEVACHLDLVPFATAQKWSQLTSLQQKSLLDLSGNFFLDLLSNSNIETIILNGQTVVESFCHSTKLELEKSQQPEWSLPRKTGLDVPGYCYFGVTKTIRGIRLNREIMILGYNHNLQSSFGVSKQVKESIKDWVTKLYLDRQNESNRKK